MRLVWPPPTDLNFPGSSCNRLQPKEQCSSVLQSDRDASLVAQLLTRTQANTEPVGRGFTFGVDRKTVDRTPELTAALPIGT